MELQTESAIRANGFLSQYMEYVANGKTPMGVGKPDWIINTPSSWIPVDLSTASVAATRQRLLGTFSGRTKWFVEKGLNVTYPGAP